MIGTPLQIIQWLYGKEKDKQFEIKEKRKKRSLSQNSYAWRLITEIGNLIGKSKEEVYFEMLKAYGQVSEISMLSSIDPKGYFKYYQIVSKRLFNNREFTIYRIYKGSSEFDTKEMTIFIEGIIQECKQLDIETMTPNEIAKLNLI